MHEHQHLGVDTLVKVLPRAGKLFCVIVSELLMLLAVVLLFIGSWKQTLINLGTKSPVAEVSLAFVYVAGLVASVLMGVLILRKLYTILFIGATEEDLMLTVESEDLANLEHAKQLFLDKQKDNVAAGAGTRA